MELYEQPAFARHSGRECRNPETKEGWLIDFLVPHPCNLDPGNPCRNDGYRSRATRMPTRALRVSDGADSRYAERT
jgi:hypothetical protein